MTLTLGVTFDSITDSGISEANFLREEFCLIDLGVIRVSGKKTLFFHLALEVPETSNNEFTIEVFMKFIKIATM